MAATSCSDSGIPEPPDAYGYARRAVDVVVAASGLAMLSPLLLATAFVLRCTGERRVRFTQERVGQHGRAFVLTKFVTMKAETVDTGGVTRNQDPSVLPVGRLLRASKLNELPQLWHVLRGEMALIGPRPLPATSFQYYPDDIRPVISCMKPGLTGIGSLFFHDEENVLLVLGKENRACYRDDIMPLKGALEVWYSQHQSVWVDLKIVTATVISLVFPRSRFFVKWFDVESLVGASSLRAYFFSR